MKECSLDLIFFIMDSQTIWFSGGGGAVFFFQYMKLDFLIQSESIYFCNHKTFFYNCY